jgi:levansucrase
MGTDEGGGETPAWTRARAAAIRRTRETVAPIVHPPARRVDPDLHLWDTWFVRTPAGAVAEVGGRRVIVALTAASDLLPGKRHDVATLRFFHSTDGRTWETGGRLFPASEPLGQRQWAGSAVLFPPGEGPDADRDADAGTGARGESGADVDADAGDLVVYYTAAGERGAPELTYGQRLAAASGGRLRAGEGGVRVEGPFEHRTLLHADGTLYEREAQSRGMIFTFRDPWYFEDPADGEAYLLFEGNTPVPEGSDACGGDPTRQEFNGSVGVAHSPSGHPLEFELRPPLLDAVCVNQELERPHVVVRDGTYYLFVSSHRHTFAPGLDGLDALYGFAADALRGDYEPLNGSGLVLANPANAPFQAYSWLAYPHREELLVTSFVNYTEYDRESLDDVALLPESEQFRRFGGTLAPTVRLRVDGRRTRVAGTLDHGHLPLPDEPLPETLDERVARLRAERGADAERAGEPGASGAGHRERERDRNGYGHRLRD